MTAPLNGGGYSGGKPFNCQDFQSTVGWQNTDSGRNAHRAFDSYVSGVLNSNIVP